MSMIITRNDIDTQAVEAGSAHITITYVIGTESIDVARDDIQGVEAYRIELDEKLRAAFPQAKHIEVMFDEGISQARIDGLDAKDAAQEETMLSQINQIADNVWNFGHWHYA